MDILGPRDDFMAERTPPRPTWAGSRRQKRRGDDSVESAALSSNVAAIGDEDMEDEENYFSPENRGGGND